jgi:hypothetical protein
MPPKYESAGRHCRWNQLYSFLLPNKKSLSCEMVSGAVGCLGFNRSHVLCLRHEVTACLDCLTPCLAVPDFQVACQYLTFRACRVLALDLVYLIGAPQWLPVPVLDPRTAVVCPSFPNSCPPTTPPERYPATASHLTTVSWLRPVPYTAPEASRF